MLTAQGEVGKRQEPECAEKHDSVKLKHCETIEGLGGGRGIVWLGLRWGKLIPATDGEEIRGRSEQRGRGWGKLPMFWGKTTHA